MKKGISLSINFIIIAIVAIAVLVVILFIFNSKAQVFTGATTKYCSCPDAQAAAENNCPEGQVISSRPLETQCSFDDAPSSVGSTAERGDVVKCCVPIGDY
ncbi:MAG: hypothetical protein R6V53_03345 [Candidatus Woesearchaeota archaeon]